MADLLYDRIIDVELTSAEYNKVITVTQSDGTLLRYYQVKTSSWTGRLWYYDANNKGDMDKFYRGLSRTGEFLKGGDRIKVYSSGLPSIYYNVSLIPLSDENQVTVKSTIHIKCPSTGIKPDISFSINMLPSGNCYKADLRIRNFNIKSIDIRKWNIMTVTVGYAGGYTETFKCPIYTSYIESPNPDGITVFEGLVVGTYGAGISQNSFKVRLLGSHTCVGKLIQEIANALDLKNKNCLIGTISGDERTGVPIYTGYNAIPIKLNGGDVAIAENGMALLNWTRDVVNKTVSFMGNPPIHISMQVIGKELVTCAVDGPNEQPVDLSTVLNLNTVFSARFTGPSLTVEAPYNPKLQPGDIFGMSPKFIDGSQLPNSMDASLYTNERNYYRVLTMSLSFSTVGDTNRMSVLAIPLQYVSEFGNTNTISGGDAVPVKTDVTTEDMEYILNNNRGELSEYVINLGYPDVNSVNQDQLVQDPPLVGDGTDMYSIDLTKSSHTFVDYVIKAGDTLSKIAEQAYTFNIYPDPKEGKASSVKPLSNNALWPLIAVATQNRYEEVEASGQSSNPWNRSTSLDRLIVGKRLCIPIINASSFKTEYSSAVNIFKYALEQYKTNEAYWSYWQVWWPAIIEYLGGTV